MSTPVKEPQSKRSKRDEDDMDDDEDHGQDQGQFSLKTVKAALGEILDEKFEKRL